MPLIWAADIEELTEMNANFRKVLWTGKHSEVTIMSIPPGSEIGLEVHRTNDQFLCIEAGQGRVKAGRTKSRLTSTVNIEDDWGIVIPAGTWHNVINTGKVPLKLFTIYSPAEHARGTVHKTKAAADAAEMAAHGRKPATKKAAGEKALRKAAKRGSPGRKRSAKR
jgi:mannose-6-phosphate isomerase-like protein (cupin superfamily)